MKRDVKYKKETFIVTLTFPRKMGGSYTYGEGKWEEDAVCIWIDEKRSEYSLNHTQYLDYKDSLQATSPIFYFDNKKEAENFAETYSLMTEYAS